MEKIFHPYHQQQLGENSARSSTDLVSYSSAAASPHYHFQSNANPNHSVASSFIPGSTGGFKKQERKVAARKTWLFVENLWIGVSEKDFMRIFSKYGELGEIFIHPNQGFAFVRMFSHANAERAKLELNGKNMCGQLLRVRYAASGTAVNVKNLSPLVSNELLYEAFAQFGKVERAVVIVDNKGRSTTRGIVEFTQKSSALNAVQQIKDGCFLITSSPRVISAAMMDEEDREDGLPEQSLTKSALYKAEREAGPRFATPGTFEEQCARAWKAWDELERNQREQLERSLKASRETIELEIKNCLHSQQASSIHATSLQLINPEVLRRQEERREREERERVEEQRKNEMERRRQLEMAGRIWSNDTSLLPSKEMVERQQRQKKILVAQIEWIKNPAKSPQSNGYQKKLEVQQVTSPGDTPGGSGKVKRKKMKCPHCSKIYLFRKSLDTHMRTHTNKNESKCEVCLKVFATEPEYNQHMLTHEGERNYKCPICDCRFIRLCSLKAHVLRHWNAAQNQKRPYGCEYCGKGFVDAQKLKTHVLQHTKEKVFKCDYCDHRFRIKHALKHHMKVKHFDKEQPEAPNNNMTDVVTTASATDANTTTTIPASSPL